MKAAPATGLICLLLASCQVPDRSDPRAFTLYREAKVSADRVPAFADCVLDGFAKARWMGGTLAVRQQRRASGFRVETHTEGLTFALASADIFDDGRVALFERNLYDMLDERAAFTACLERLSE